MILVEEVEVIDDVEDKQIADSYLEIAEDMEPVQIIEEDFSWGRDKVSLYGYVYESKLEEETESIDLLCWQEHQGYAYMLKYMGTGVSLQEARAAMEELVSNFNWGQAPASTADVSESDSVNILILGDDSAYDRAGGRVSGRTDIIILMHLNLETYKGTIVTIPRDTWVEIPGHGSTKINAAHALGGNDLTVETIENFSGLEIEQLHNN
ncbi:MAG: LCP family protein [Actinomycetota bacterium]|nr:LCP family protein [Actinomycetota bacterium]